MGRWHRSRRRTERFERTELDNISETFDGDFVLGLDIYYLGGQKQSAFISYTLSPTIKTKYRQCTPEFAKSRCGECIVHLEDDWWIKYGWEPSSFVPDLQDSDEYGEWSEETFLKEASAAWEACLVEGGTQLERESDEQ